MGQLRWQRARFCSLGAWRIALAITGDRRKRAIKQMEAQREFDWKVLSNPGQPPTGVGAMAVMSLPPRHHVIRYLSSLYQNDCGPLRYVQYFGSEAKAMCRTGLMFRSSLVMSSSEWICWSASSRQSAHIVAMSRRYRS